MMEEQEKNRENIASYETSVTVPAGAIGEAAAKAAALAHAGVTEQQVKYVTCDPQIGHGPDHYDVKFVTRGMKYKYAVDLYDGSIQGRAVKDKAAKGKYVYEGDYHEHHATVPPQTVPNPAGAPQAVSNPAGKPQTPQEAAAAPEASPIAPQQAAAAAPGTVPASPDTAPVTAHAMTETPVPAAAAQTVPVAPASAAAAQTAATTASVQALSGAAIDEQQALAIAMQQAGLAQSDLIRYRMKLRDKHGSLLYRFKLKIPGYECEVDVDSRTGKVTKFHREIDT